MNKAKGRFKALICSGTPDSKKILRNKNIEMISRGNLHTFIFREIAFILNTFILANFNAMEMLMIKPIKTNNSGKLIGKKSLPKKSIMGAMMRGIKLWKTSFKFRFVDSFDLSTGLSKVKYPTKTIKINGINKAKTIK